MSKENSEIIKEQQEQLSELEAILTDLFNKPKVVGIVEAGPFNQEGTNHYAVKIDSKSAIVVKPDVDCFGQEVRELEIGDQVAIIEGGIVGIIPKILQIQQDVVKVKLTSFDEVGGLKSQIDNIKELVEIPLKHADLARDFGITPSKGLLLYGPPGTGKTLIAKAIASMILESDSVDARAFTYIKGAEMLSMYVGDTEQRITRMFKNAREYSEETGQQAVIFIDEAEAILPKRGSRRSSDVDTTIVPTFLSEMDGFAEHNPFIILSTNIPDNLDDAVLREGRIDVKVPIMRPSKEDAKEIFAIHFNGIACHDKVEVLCNYAAEELYRCDLKKRVSGAMIKTIVNSAARAAMKRVVVSPKTKKVGVAKEDIVKSLILINHGTDQ